MTDIVKAESEELATQLEAEAKSLVDDSWGDISPEDETLQVIRLLQGMSKPVTEQTPGAQMGKFFNSGTEESIDGGKGIVFSPLGKVRHYLELRPQGYQGSRFVASHQPDSSVIQQLKADNNDSLFGKLSRVDSEGVENTIRESVDIFGALLSEDGKEFLGSCALLPFSSTAIKPVRKLWGSLLCIYPRRPLFCIRIKMTAFKNPDTSKGTFYSPRFTPALGESWKNTLIQPNLEPELFEQMLGCFKRYKETVRDTLSKTYSNEEAPASQHQASNESSLDGTLDADLPF